MSIRLAGAGGRPTLAISLLLASLSMISPLSIDTFLPSFPAIAKEFDLTSWQVQQLITAYLLPFACFALVHGPLSDALGRRRVIMWGLAAYTVGSRGCLLAPNFGMLIAFRILQGIAAGLGPTVARAIVRDSFEGANAQRLMSNMMLLFSIAPAVAPIVGGWMQVAAGWRSVFGLLSAMGAILLIIVWKKLPETLPVEQRAVFKVSELAHNCWRVGSNPRFVLLALSSAMAFSALFIHFGSAPAIVLDTWKLKETQFHYVFLPIVAGLMVASFTSGRIAGRVSRHLQLQYGFALQLIAAVLAAAAHFGLPLLGIAEVPKWLIQVMWFVMSIGAQLNFPIITLEMLDMNPTRRGAAASVQSFISLGIGALMMGFAAPMMQGNLKWLAVFSLVASLIAVVIWRASAAWPHPPDPAPNPTTPGH